ncbi:YcxB family protein [Actinoplanes sp. NPDC051861]|uniref:YcxB family protein n=1 Tax=Actinoplanes sp. NPDC051861 TaxID=3155170 RepID=UPI00342C477E
MAPFTFSAHPTQAQLIASLNHFLKPQYRVYRVSGVILLVLGVILLLLEDYYVGPLALVLGVFCRWGLPPLVTRMVLRRAASLLDRPTDYRIDEDGVWVGNDQAESLFHWKAVDRVDELPGMLIGRLGKAGFFAVPLDGLDPETAAQLTAFIRAHVPARG